MVAPPGGAGPGPGRLHGEGRRGALADPETLLGELDQLVQQRKERLANFEAEARKLERQSEGNSRFQHLTLRRGILDQEAWLSWAEEVREVLEDALSHQH